MILDALESHKFANERISASAASENGGAYGAAMSSRYNLRDPAREVILEGEPGEEPGGGLVPGGALTRRATSGVPR